MQHEKLIELLKKEMIPAMGCTEPAASALAGAQASFILGEEVLRAEVSASRDIVKNAMGVGLPSCSLKGILAAVALGIVKKDTSLSLSILSDITPKQIEDAGKIKATLSLEENVPPLYVKVKVFGKNHNATAVVANEHNRFAYIERDGEILKELPVINDCSSGVQEDSIASDLLLQDVYDFATTVDISQLGFIRDAINTNMKIASHSIEKGYGLQVGKTLLETTAKTDDLSYAFRKASCYAAAGSDARMSGCPMCVIINSGSGNQGITVTVPVEILGKHLGVSEEQILRAVCLSELAGLVLTARKNRLSALCGAFTASIATSCAYVYLLGGGVCEMDKAVNTMVGDLSGIICDGAKNTCALKIFSCLEAAAMASILAVRGLGPGKESGIVGKDSFESINYLSEISSKGMRETDHNILSIMLEKN